MVRRPKDVVLVKRAVPKEVALPNGRRFTAIYKRATRAPLPNKNPPSNATLPPPLPPK